MVWCNCQACAEHEGGGDVIVGEGLSAPVAVGAAHGVVTRAPPAGVRRAGDLDMPVFMGLSWMEAAPILMGAASRPSGQQDSSSFTE